VAKVRVSFLCSACGAVQPKWLGRCPECGGWNTLERFAEMPGDDDDLVDHGAAGDLGTAASDPLGDSTESSGDRPHRTTIDPRRSAPQPLSEVSVRAIPRITTGVAEFDRVLGGGLVPGSTILLGGEPGIGKSTLLLQALLSIAKSGLRTLYATSEESSQQVRLRADRISPGTTDPAADARGSTDPGARTPTDLLLHADSQLDRVLEHARKLRPTVLAVDSIQLVSRSGLDAAPGSITQLRRCCLDLVHFAKRSGCAVILVGHVTKEGVLSGPKVLEHMVDVVLSFEGDRHHLHRVVRATKNRFGSTQEVGLFEMTGAGLSEVDDSALALESAHSPRPGSVLVSTLAGSRAMLAEIQALTATGFLGNAKRKTSGIDGSRASMLIAVLEKHAGLRLADQDIYVSCAGGLRVSEPAVDLGVALAIAGSHLRRALPVRTAVLGEVSLAGDLRAVRQFGARVAAAHRRGVRTMVVPESNRESVGGVRFIRVQRVSDAIDLLEAATARRSPTHSDS